MNQIRRERERERAKTSEWAKCLENIYLLHWTKCRKTTTTEIRKLRVAQNGKIVHRIGTDLNETVRLRYVLVPNTHTPKHSQTSRAFSVPLLQRNIRQQVISRLIKNTIDGWVRTLIASLHHQNLFNIRYWSHLKRHRLMNNNLLSITLARRGCLLPMNSIFSLTTRLQSRKCN